MSTPTVIELLDLALQAERSGDSQRPANTSDG